MMTGTGLGGSARKACSVGRFGIGSRYVAHSGWGCSALVGRGSSGGLV